MDIHFNNWIELESGEQVRYGKLAHMMALALYPSDDEGIGYEFAKTNLRGELRVAAISGELIVRNPVSRTRDSLPNDDSIILHHDLIPFLAERGIGLRIQDSAALPGPPSLCSVSDLQAAPASEQVTPAAEPAAKGVTKAQILIAFGEVLIKGKKQETVSNAMENGYVWAVRARLAQGTRGRGGHESQWCPVLMAIELHERKFATKAALNRAFLEHQFLSGWREQWHEHSEAI